MSGTVSDASLTHCTQLAVHAPEQLQEIAAQQAATVAAARHGAGTAEDATEQAGAALQYDYCRRLGLAVARLPRSFSKQVGVRVDLWRLSPRVCTRVACDGE